MTAEWAEPVRASSGSHEKGCLGYGAGGDKLRSLSQEHQRNIASSFQLSDHIDLSSFFPFWGRYRMEVKGAGPRVLLFQFLTSFPPFTSGFRANYLISSSFVCPCFPPAPSVEEMGYVQGSMVIDLPCTERG